MAFINMSIKNAGLSRMPDTWCCWEFIWAIYDRMQVHWSLCEKQEESESGKPKLCLSIMSVFLGISRSYPWITLFCYVGCRFVGSGRKSAQKMTEASNVSWTMFSTNPVGSYAMSASSDEGLWALAESVKTQFAFACVVMCARCSDSSVPMSVPFHVSCHRDDQRVCGENGSETRTESVGCWMWHWWRWLLHGREIRCSCCWYRSVCQHDLFRIGACHWTQLLGWVWGCGLHHKRVPWPFLWCHLQSWHYPAHPSTTQPFISQFFSLGSLSLPRLTGSPPMLSLSLSLFQDKPALFRTFFKWLKPGGKVLISDYCRSPKTPSAEFSEYIKQRGYDLHDVQAYGQVCFLSSMKYCFSQKSKPFL